MPQDVPSTSDRRLIKLKNQVQRLMEAHLAPKSSVQVNKIASSCEICSGPHGTQYCMENPEQAFVEYASSRTDEAGGKWVIEVGTPKPEESEKALEDEFKDLHLNLLVLKVLAHSLMYNALLDKYVENLDLGKNGSAFIQGIMPKKMKDSRLFTLPCSLGDSKPFDTIADLGSCYDDSSEEELEEDESAVTGELGVEYFERFPTRSELAYHKEDPEGIKVISNFTRRIRGIHIFVGNFTYVSDFMIFEDISLVIDPRLSQVVLGIPFVEISNMTHDLTLGIVRFANGTDKIAYKMPHKIKQLNLLLDFEKEHSKLVYFRNEEDKMRGVDYVVNKILGIYKECLELGPEYLTGLEEGEVNEEGGVTLYLMRRSFGVLRSIIWTILE
ncbi:hypothetical protein Tco_0483744 [Tanacetum coccineum]